MKALINISTNPRVLNYPPEWVGQPGSAATTLLIITLIEGSSVFKALTTIYLITIKYIRASRKKLRQNIAKFWEAESYTAIAFSRQYNKVELKRDFEEIKLRQLNI